MRVLVTSPVFPPDLGGPAVYVPSFARYLQEVGHEVKVVAFCSVEPTGHPFPVKRIGPGSLPVRYLKAFFVVLREAKDVDVVYVNEHLALLHVLAAKLRRKPVVIRLMVDGTWEIAHRRGWIGNDDIVTYETKSYGWRVGLARFLQRRWWGWCNKLIACSEFLRRIPIDHYGVADDKVVRIFNAYHGPAAEDVPQTPEQARAELELPEGRRYLLTVCRLMVWKGVDVILRSLADLPDDVHLLVAGDGDMLEPWQELARELGVADRAHFLGNVPHEKVPLYVRAADLFILASEYEGLSHTLLEVASLGTPMVATGVCGNPEVVEDGVNGLTVPPKDPGALASAVSKLLSDKALREKYVAESRARMGRFSRSETFGKVVALLRKVSGA